MQTPKTTKFLTKVENKHGNKYDLSKVDYVNSYTSITVICPIHGEFSKIPSEFLRDGGCRKCGNASKCSDWSEVRRRFEFKYNNKFDYSNSVYINDKSKMEVLCKTHNVTFNISPAHHKLFEGCPECRKETYGKHLMLSPEEFITKCNFEHNNKYDYTNSIYKGYDHPISITCKEHGIFELSKARKHIKGMGCPLCK